MWTPCPVALDTPITLGGFEIEDVAVVGLSPLLLAFVADTLVCFGGAALLGAALYYAKRGKPPGALLHALHALQLTKLPGLLSPTRKRFSPW